MSFLKGRFTKQELADMFRDAGFRVVSVEPVLSGLGLVAVAEKNG